MCRLPLTERLGDLQGSRSLQGSEQNRRNSRVGHDKRFGVATWLDVTPPGKRLLAMCKPDTQAFTSPGRTTPASRVAGGSCKLLVQKCGRRGVSYQVE